MGETLNVLDLFSGIGGFSLGLERAGMRTVSFCESDPYCQRVLRKHWPDVPVFDDVRTLTAEALSNANCFRCEGNNGIPPEEGSQFPNQPCRDAGAVRPMARAIDVIAGGFPCQDISVAGKGAGIEGSRSGLWAEYARIIGEVRPRYVIVENVAALLGRGIERVLGDLAALGLHAEWHCIPASAIGAPHRRDRVWIVAYSNRNGRGGRIKSSSDMERDLREPAQLRHGQGQAESDVADADQPRLEGRLRAILQECAEQRFAWAGGFQGWDEQRWFAESGMGRVANGVPARVERLRALGNAIVPQIAEIIGRAILTMSREGI